MAVQEIVEVESLTIARQVCARMRARRRAMGLGIKEVGLACGTSPQTISRIETGEMTCSLNWLERIAKVLRCEPWQLLTDCPMSIGDAEREALRNLMNESLAILGERE